MSRTIHAGARGTSEWPPLRGRRSAGEHDKWLNQFRGKSNCAELTSWLRNHRARSHRSEASVFVFARIESRILKAFLNAGIEEVATLREWHTALASAIQNGYPVMAIALAPYRAQATANLRLASTAASTESDHSAYQLLNNEFQKMVKLTDKYVTARANMTYVSPDALENDILNQRFVACGHSLGAMAASGQFVDDGYCD